MRKSTESGWNVSGISVNEEKL